MKNCHGYIGIFDPFAIDYSKTIYCVSSPDCRNLVMIPLVPNFFETAYKFACKPKFQRIFMVLPSLDMLYVSAAYLFYYKIEKVLGKQVEFFCPFKPQIPVTDEFYSHVHVSGDREEIQFTKYLTLDESFDIKMEYRAYPHMKAINRSVADIYLSTNDKRILFCMWMDENKLKTLTDIEVIDEIHMPYLANLYGGMIYVQTRKSISPAHVSKLYAYGFSSETEINMCEMIGKVGKRYDSVQELNG